MKAMGLRRDLDNSEEKVWKMLDEENLSFSDIDKKLGKYDGYARDIIVSIWYEDARSRCK